MSQAYRRALRCRSGCGCGLLPALGTLGTALLAAAIVAVAIFPGLLEAAAIARLEAGRRATVAAMRTVTAVAALLERTATTCVVRPALAVATLRRAFTAVLTWTARLVAIAATRTRGVAGRFALAVETRTLAERATIFARLEIAARTIGAISKRLGTERLAVALRAAIVTAFAAMLATGLATILERPLTIAIARVGCTGAFRTVATI